MHGGSVHGNGLTAYLFGSVAFLENANGAPKSGRVSREPHAHLSSTNQSNCSFPTDEGKNRFKGLSPASASINTEADCAAACCAMGEDQCPLYQFYATREPGQVSQCWVGRPTHVQGRPPPGFVSRSRGHPPNPPAPPGDVTVTFRGRKYVLPPYSVSIVSTSDGSVLFASRNTSAAKSANTRTFANATASPLQWTCWSELSRIMDSAFASDPPRGVIHAPHPLEQLNLTLDRTEYVLYGAEVQAHMLSRRPGGHSLTLQGRVSNAYAVFVDGELVGDADNHAHSYGGQSFDIRWSTHGAGGSASRDGGLRSRLAVLSTSIGMHSHIGLGGMVR